ncbi:MAG: sodium:proton antiporter [Ponticaulis sp.]|nr:sodium:proton antiporter [Ponticaulis sp.]
MTEVLDTVIAAVLSEGWRHWVGSILCLIGAVSTVIAAVGVLRFPDFYTRLHAASVTDTLGALTLLAGMALLAPGIFIVIKMILIGLFLVLTGPTSAHAIANAAYTAGLEPLIGKFRDLKDEDEGESENG